MSLDEWAVVERRYSNMDPELRGRYEGMLEAWFWDHPQEQQTSTHRLPALKKYGKVGEAEIFLSADDFDPDDLFAVVDYMNEDGNIWWLRPLVEGKELMVIIATSENETGIPEDWDSLPNFDRDEWQEAINQWLMN